MMNLHYDRQGNPIDFMEWGMLVEDIKYKRVRSTSLWFGLIWVSTVWLGIDHDFSHSWNEPNHQPIIFESMTFVRNGSDSPTERYVTEAEAKKGHWRMVRYYLNPINAYKEIREQRKAYKELYK